jgi:hypothetical protein
MGTARLMEFYDAATWQNIPHGAAACLAVDGIYAAPASAPADLGLTDHRWITVDGDYRNASIIDWEKGDPAFSDRKLRRFVRGRRAAGQRAIVYCDRADAREAWQALTEGDDVRLRDYAEWWISTLDGVKRTAEQLAAELRDAWGAPIPASQIWACQHTGGMTAKVDTSTLLGTW